MSSPTLTFFLSQTIRNPTTYQKFCHLLHASGYVIDDPKPVNFGEVVFGGDSESDIKIIKISKAQATTCS